MVHASRVVSVDLTTLIDHWHKCWWKSFQAKLRRQAMQEEYMAAHPPPSGQDSWQVLLTPQFHSCRLLYVTALHVRHRNYDRLVELWRCRAQRSHFSHYRLYTDCCVSQNEDSSDPPQADGDRASVSRRRR